MANGRHIFGHYTATRVRWDEDAEGNPIEEPIEEHGWIDWNWSSRQLHESRNDVRPYVDVDEDDPELYEEIQDAFRNLPGGPEREGHQGTFYAADTDSPFDEVWSYSYALHFTCKFFGPNGWTEQPWEPDLTQAKAAA